MTPYSELDLGLGGFSETLGVILALLAIGGLVLTVLGLVYAVRTWMAQSAAFQTRKDVAEIKRMLEGMQPAARTPVKSDENGRVIAQNIDRPQP